MNSLAELDAFIGKCQTAEEALSRARGGFALFGLFERSDFLGSWDIVVAAPWFGTDHEAIQAIVDQLMPLFSKAEWLSVSRIVPLDLGGDFLRTINRLVTTQHEVKEFFALGVVQGIAINHAYIITSDASAVGATVKQTVAA